MVKTARIGSAQKLAIGPIICRIRRRTEALGPMNDHPDADDKARRIAELEAGQVLLKAPRAKLNAVKEIIVRCLRYLGEKLADNTIEILISAAITAIAAAFGIHVLL